MIFEHPDFDDHEQVMFARDAAAGLTAIIAVHSTSLGPSLGGCRIWKYDSEIEAISDVLRLSRGMTYKAALAGLPLGGGKSVVLADAHTQKTPEMMRAMGRAVERLAGRYIVAEDVGATVADIDLMAEETSSVSGRSGGTGDPSPWTAEGVFLSMQAAAQERWGTGLEGRSVTVKGLGSVGASLCEKLHFAGAALRVADIRADAMIRVCQMTGAKPVPPEGAHAEPTEIFAPCALGAGLNVGTIPEIEAEIVCGAANNQLATPDDGILLKARKILYAPDYLVNAGGLISVAREPLGMSAPDAEAKLKAIPETLRCVLKVAVQRDVCPGAAADGVAEAKFKSAA